MAMFKRFVEPGRLALITYGPCAGKMCTITDIVDQQRVVVDGPASVTGVQRHMMPTKRLSLTDFKSNIVRGAREKALRLALEKDDTMSKWAATSWAKKLKAREVRSNMSDFERFKLMMAKKNRSKVIRKALKAKKEPGRGWRERAADRGQTRRPAQRGPQSVTGVARHMMPTKRLSLTDLKADIVRGAREKALKQALEKGDIMAKWAATSWGKKLKAR
eukprot:CAMPEP_0171184240 /NCGR_PEP_ID=MMETSP0790-20130122/15689_1 /TAXON_ID=2925 /ORGANISM="Alexandrium catenella, Strain OF101" /LENGTH=217 /DNA_ID=CAMNT_0011649235 /DNA_START=87 /DNA_END=737 /DNA_ORIENTATION=-